jgi:ArsR family transcriptional regulator
VRAGSVDARLLACLRAAAHPIRLQVLQLLAGAGAPVCVCDITPRFRLTQPTISHHLRILRQAGLVSASRRGIWGYYAVRPAGMDVLRRGVASLAMDPCCADG